MAVQQRVTILRTVLVGYVFDDYNAGERWQKPLSSRVIHFRAALIDREWFGRFRTLRSQGLDVPGAAAVGLGSHVSYLATEKLRILANYAHPSLGNTSTWIGVIYGVSY